MQSVNKSGAAEIAKSVEQADDESSQPQRYSGVALFALGTLVVQNCGAILIMRYTRCGVTPRYSFTPSAGQSLKKASI